MAGRCLDISLLLSALYPTSVCGMLCVVVKFASSQAARINDRYLVERIRSGVCRGSCVIVCTFFLSDLSHVSITSRTWSGPLNSLGSASRRAPCSRYFIPGRGEREVRLLIRIAKINPVAPQRTRTRIPAPHSAHLDSTTEVQRSSFPGIREDFTTAWPV